MQQLKVTMKVIRLADLKVGATVRYVDKAGATRTGIITNDRGAGFRIDHVSDTVYATSVLEVVQKAGLQVTVGRRCQRRSVRSSWSDCGQKLNRRMTDVNL